MWPAFMFSNRQETFNEAYHVNMLACAESLRRRRPNRDA
jgi:hypothetical protein